MTQTVIISPRDREAFLRDLERARSVASPPGLGTG